MALGSGVFSKPSLLRCHQLYETAARPTGKIPQTGVEMEPGGRKNRCRKSNPRTLSLRKSAPSNIRRKNMSRSPIARLVTQLYRDSRGAALAQIPIDEFVEQQAVKRKTRREFLGQSGRTLVGAATMAGFSGSLNAGTHSSAQIAIVGAGLAGLTCAWRLRQAGFNSTVFEANARLGGRCYTRRGFFAQNQIVERGGELIDTDHTAVLDLAAELGLVVDDLQASEPDGTLPFYYFGSSAYSYTQILERFQAIYPALQADLDAVGDIDYTTSTPRGAQLDHTSLADYIEQLTDKVGDRVLARLLNVAYTEEFGAETNQQTSLNLLFLLGYSAQDAFQIYGNSDERYHIRGGNDQLVSGLRTRLAGSIRTASPLEAIRKLTDGRYQLEFQDGYTRRSITAEHVVLALPFSVLRSFVDISSAGFSPLKKTAIKTLGMGANAKLHLQFRSRRWNQLGNNGDTYSDTGYQNTWESSRAQAGTNGILVNYTGGTTTFRYGTGPLNQRVSEALRNLEPVLPGLSSKYNGLATLDFWPGNLWSQGSYSYWKVGQYTTIAGSEGIREGNVHFCGEHTSFEYQGYLNGAVDSGNAVAAEVIADLR